MQTWGLMTVVAKPIVSQCLALPGRHFSEHAVVSAVTCSAMFSQIL